MKKRESFNDFVLSGVTLMNDDVWLNFKSNKPIRREEENFIETEWATCSVHYSRVKDLIPTLEDDTSELAILHTGTGLTLESLIKEFKDFGVDLTKYLNRGNEIRRNKRLL